ncbi:MAG: DegV family EDD domain-containing protein, partial [Gemmatimonadetes bacterium]|nr:DegV family EDD domain-containing protein [Gemmatimonadota bacterium]
AGGAGGTEEAEGASPLSAAARTEVAPERDFRFCTEVLVRGPALPAPHAARAAVRPLGGSIVVLNTGSALKVHVHTDTPDRLFALAREWGIVEATKAEDMQAQHRGLTRAAPRIAIVVDSSCDLPEGLPAHHGITVVPLQVVAGTRTYLDGVDLRPGEVYQLMRRTREPLTTSQPAPGAFLQAFKHARTDASEILCIVLGAALSGTFTSAQAAARAAGGDGIAVVDSRSASLGLGLLALRAAELVEQGLSLAAIVAELNRVRGRAAGLFTVDRFENLLRSGRVSRGKAWLGRVLDVKPILEIDTAGRVVPLDRVRGRAAALPRVLKHLDRRLTPRPHRLRLGVVHADAADVAERVRETLVRRYQPFECLVGPVTAAVGVHAGPGAWGVFYQVEDQEPAVGGNQTPANSLL